MEHFVYHISMNTYLTYVKYHSKNLKQLFCCPMYNTAVVTNLADMALRNPSSEEIRLKYIGRTTFSFSKPAWLIESIYPIRA